MIKKAYENALLWVVGLVDLLETAFVKYFPYFAVTYGAVFILGLEGGIKSGNITLNDIPYLIIKTLIFIVVCLFWTLKKRDEK